MVDVFPYFVWRGWGWIINCPIMEQKNVDMLNFALSKDIQKCNWKEKEEGVLEKS